MFKNILHKKKEKSVLLSIFECKEVCALFHVAVSRRVEQDKQYKDEEQRLRTANSRAIQEMKQKMERELENAKLELLEVRVPSAGIRHRLRNSKFSFHCDTQT